MEVKLCKDCGKEPREAGKVRCLRCSIRIWQRTVKKTARDKLRAIEYRGGKCHKCGYGDLSILDVFEFHHINGEDKDYEMNKLFGRCGWEIIKKEADKCVVLCVMCHRKEHYYIRKDEEHKRLALLPSKSTNWPEEDIRLLRSLSGYSMRQMREHLPQYSTQQIQKKCQDHNLLVIGCGA